MPELIVYLNSAEHLLKVGILILLFLAILFIGVIINQIRAMNKIVSLPASFVILQTVAIILLILAISLFALAVVIL